LVVIAWRCAALSLLQWACVRLLSAMLVLGMLGGCVPPGGVRRTVLAPPVTLPVRLGAPLPAGEGRAGLDINAIDVGFGPLLTPGFGPAELGDPGVLVPQVELGAFAYLGASDVFEFGGRVGYTQGSWAEPNLRGVIALPKSHSGSLWSAAIGTRMNFELVKEQRLVLSPIIELELANVPEAVFCPAMKCKGEQSADPDYVLHEYSETLFFVPDIALQAGTRVSDLLFAELVLGTQSTVKNIGFDKLANIDDSTTSTYWTGYLGVGLDMHIDWFFVGGHIYFVVDGQDKIDHGLRSLLQLGYARK